MNRTIRLALTIGIALSLAACATSQTEVISTPTPTSSPQSSATHTLAPPTPTDTPLPPTDTPIPPTDTLPPPTATFTASPTVTDTVEPTPGPNPCNQAPSISGGNTARLTVVNKSGYEVYMKLEGCSSSSAFYYLTIPAGTSDNPVTEVFSVLPGAYSRTTWQCDGIQSSGLFLVTGSLRLVFEPCGAGATATSTP